MSTNNYGILASVSWNSKKWQDDPTEKDLDNSKYAYVIENRHMHESLNFGHEKYPLEHDGTYIAYTPMFNNMPSLEESKNVAIVFFRSLDYKNDKNYIIGFYAYPIIDEFTRHAQHTYYEYYGSGNIKAKPDDIVLLRKPLEVTDEIVAREHLLPSGKKLGQQGFNYLTYENVIKILDKATTLNPTDMKLKGIKFKLLKNRPKVSA